MDRETKKFIRTIEKRIQEIPGHKKRGLYQPVDPGKAAILDSFCRTFITRADLVNPRPVEEAAKRAANHEPVTVVCAHRSNGDNGAVPFTVNQFGFGDFARSWVFLMGIKMWEDRYTRGFQGCLNTILTISPLEDAKFKNMLQNPQKYNLGVQEIRLLGQYKPLKEELVAEGFRLTLDMQSKGHPIFTYPEATRARGGHLQRAPRAVAALFMKQPSWILPLTVSGTERIFPVGSPVPIRRGSVIVTAGELVSSEELVSRYRQNKYQYGREITAADYIMARIAVLDPGRVTPEDLSLYRKLLSA